MENKKSWEPAKKSWIVFTLVVALLAGAIRALQTAELGIADSDYYWHVTLGKYIVENHSIFREDIFSWIAMERGYTETAHSWLASMVLYGFSRISKDPFIGGVIYNGVTMVIMTFILVWFYGRPFDRKNPKLFFLNAVFSLVVAFVPIMSVEQPRPGCIGMILFVLAMYLLHDAYENMDSKKWLFLPLISLLWANFHGGSVPMLFAFTAMFLVMSFIPKFSIAGVGQVWERTKQRVVRMIAILLSEIAAALVNPYGWKLFIYFFYTNNATTKKYIAEWRHAALLLPGVIFALAVIVLVLWFRKKNETIDISYVLPLGATLFMTGVYIRIEMYLIVCTIIFASYAVRINCWGYEPKRFNTMTSPQLTPMLAVVAVLFMVVTGVLANLPNENRLKDPVTPELCEFLDETQPRRMYTTYNHGGYLIFHGYKSFIDSRADLFPGEMLDAAIRFDDAKEFTSDELEAYISEFDFDAIMLSPTNEVNVWFQLHPDWTEAYADDDFVIYMQTSVVGG